jgi:methionine-rich copper-binding protein CopC
VKRAIVVVLFIVLGGTARLKAHAFVEHAEPAPGSTVQTSPAEVKIRFTEKIEASFSSIQVFDASGKEVDKRDVHLDHSDRALLHVSLLQLGAGTYKVAWRVVSVDTHVTNGTFTFRVVR